MGSDPVTHGPVDGLRVGRYGFGSSTKAYCYRIGHTLIDTGPPNQWSAVRGWVEAQHAERSIERVLVTHHHEDHAGNAARIQEMLDVPVYAPEASLERLAEGFSVETYRWIVWGRPVPVEAEPVPAQMMLADGTALRTIAAPGHADDMVCYLAEDHGLLFTADLFLTRRPEYLRFDEAVHPLIQSIHRVLRHDFQTVLCAHQGVVEDGRQALKAKARYLEALCGVVQQRYRSDKLSLDAIREEILGKEGSLYYISGGDFSKHNLIASCLDRSAEEQGEIVGGRGIG